MVTLIGILGNGWEIQKKGVNFNKEGFLVENIWEMQKKSGNFDRKVKKTDEKCMRREEILMGELIEANIYSSRGLTCYQVKDFAHTYRQIRYY